MKITLATFANLWIIAIAMANTNDKTDTTVALRVPMKLREFYEGIAAKERRKLSQVLRLVLEDYYAKNKKKAA